MEKLQITMTPKQARIINVALEEYFRAPLGQWRDLAERLAFRGFNYKNNTNGEFEKRVAKLEYAAYTFDAAGNIAMGRFGATLRTPDEQIASDMWRVLRWWLMTPEARQEIPRDTYHEGDEPPIKVEALGND